MTAHFLHTTLHVEGKIVDEYPRIKGRTIVLTAASQDARVEDLIRLAAKGADPMTGSCILKVGIEIPEGDADLSERLRLNAQFGIGDAQFTKPSIQEKVDTLSRKGQGQPTNMDIDDVVSEMRGSVTVKDSLASFSNLNFSVPGASVILAGTYHLDTRQLDFHGKLMLKAKPSQTTTGVKSFFLKAIDPFLKGRHAGAVLPIRSLDRKIILYSAWITAARRFHAGPHA